MALLHHHAASVRWEDDRRDPLLAGLAAPLGYFAAAVLAIILTLAIGHRHPLVALCAFGCLAALVAAPAKLRWAPAIGLLCWFFLDGFLLNRGGALGWHGSDQLALLVLPLAACAGSAVSAFRSSREWDRFIALSVRAESVDRPHL